jgi:hypothetical protein
MLLQRDVRVSRPRSDSRLPPPNLSMAMAAIAPTRGFPPSSVRSASIVTVEPGAAFPLTSCPVTLGKVVGSTNTRALAKTVGPSARGTARCRSTGPVTRGSSVSEPLPEARSTLVVVLTGWSVGRAKTAAFVLGAPKTSKSSFSPGRTTSFAGRSSTPSSRRTGTQVASPSGPTKAPPNAPRVPSLGSTARTVSPTATLPGQGPTSRKAPASRGTCHVTSASPCAFVVKRASRPSPFTVKVPTSGSPRSRVSWKTTRWLLPRSSSPLSGVMVTVPRCSPTSTLARRTIV